MIFEFDQQIRISVTIQVGAYAVLQPSVWQIPNTRINNTTRIDSLLCTLTTVSLLLPTPVCQELSLVLGLQPGHSRPAVLACGFYNLEAHEYGI